MPPAYRLYGKVQTTQELPEYLSSNLPDAIAARRKCKLQSNFEPEPAPARATPQHVVKVAVSQSSESTRGICPIVDV